MQTNESGNYTVPFLVPGSYHIEVQKEGFKTVARRDVVLQVGDVIRVSFTLELGAVAQAVEVSATVPLIATESTAVGTVVENKRIVELPLNGRNYLQLIAISPNVAAEQIKSGSASSRQGGDRAEQSYSIAGQRMTFSRFTLDGIENTDMNFNTFVVRPSIEALQEFKVQTGVYSAEYGRATAQVNVTTKSGSNAFHGSVFEFLRNDVLDAREWRKAGSKNPFRRNQYGFTLGGRLLRDKLFFMSNFEALRDRKTLQQLANVATDKMRAGDFSGQSRVIFDPVTRALQTDSQGNIKAVSATRFPNNVVPQARFSPAALKLLEFYPTATKPGDNILTNYSRNSKRRLSWEQFTQRIDWTQSDRSNWFGRFSWGNEALGDVATFPSQQGRIETRVIQTVLSNTRVFSSSVVNELRFGYNQFLNEILTHWAHDRDVGTELGIAGLPVNGPSAWGAPSISLSDGLSGFNESGNGPFTNHNHTLQIMDNLSVVRGKHSFKFGGEIRRDRFNQLGNQFPRGSFIFQAQATFDPANRASTGHSFADFLLGEASTAQKSVGLANALFRVTSQTLYFEDTWKITPRVSMNIGLRYENTPPFHDKYRGMINAALPGGILNPNAVAILTRPGDGDFYQGMAFHFTDGIPTQVGDKYLGRALISRDNNDFAPRLGLVYSPTDRWTVRSGIGVFYAQDIGNARFDLARNLSGRSDWTSNVEKPNVNLSDPWKYETAQAKCTGWAGACQAAPVIFANYSNRRTPYVTQWILNMQRQLRQNVALEVGYQGSEGHKLETMTNINIALPRTGPTDTRSVTQRRPWPVYGNMQEVGNQSDSNYHALMIKLQQQFHKGLTYLVSYTWSKSIDSSSGIRTDPGDPGGFAQNPYNLHDLRGLSQFHVGRRLVGSFIYELPFGGGKRFLSQRGLVDKVVGGWQVGSIVTFADGTPYGVGGTSDAMNLGYTGCCMPDATGISPFPQKQTIDQFWNMAAFDVTNPQLAYRFGNAGRSALRGPGFRQMDFSLTKNTKIREGHSLQFRFEAFNFPNHPNWLTPSTSPRSPATFGKITAARTMREMQFGLKYSF
jgi:outer membrane receptor protein involved in Fe transport